MRKHTHIPGVTRDDETGDVYGGDHRLGAVKSFAGTWFYTLPGYQGGVIVSSKREAIELVARQFLATREVLP